MPPSVVWRKFFVIEAEAADPSCEPLPCLYVTWFLCFQGISVILLLCSPIEQRASAPPHYKSKEALRNQMFVEGDDPCLAALNGPCERCDPSARERHPAQ